MKLNFAKSKDMSCTWVAVGRRTPNVHDELEGAGAEPVDALADVGAGVGGGVHPPDLEVPIEVAKHRVPCPTIWVDPLITLKHSI